MTIGIDASRANKKEKTGTEWYSYYLIQHLKKIIPPQYRVILYAKEPLTDGLEILPANWQSKVLNWPPKFLWTQWRLSLEMLFHPVDLLFVPAHTISLIHPKKTVTVCHDIGFVRFPQYYSVKERMYHRFTMWLALKCAKIIITPSQFTKNEIMDVYKVSEKKIKVIYHGPPTV